MDTRNVIIENEKKEKKYGHCCRTAMCVASLFQRWGRETAVVCWQTQTLSLSHLSLSHTYTNTHTHAHAHTHTYARSESYWHQLKMARIKKDFLSTVNNDKYLIFMEPSYFSSCHLLLLLRCFVCAGETVLILFTVHSWTDKWPHISY